MKSVLITPQFPPACCGVGDFTYHLARAMQQHGRHVTILTEPVRGQRPEGVPLIELPLRGWRNVRGVLEAVRSTGCEHVQLEYSSYGWGRWGFSFAVNALAFALRARGVRLTLGLHELYLPWRLRPFALACGLVQRVHLALLFLAANDILANTPQRVRAVQRWVPWRADPVRFRHTPSNIALHPVSDARREELRRERGAAPETAVVALFGSFHPAKNYEAVIDAALQLGAGTPLQLWFLGDQRSSAVYVAQLRRRAEPLGRAVFWPGLTPARQISEWLQAADIFVLPQTDGHLTRSGAFMAAAAHALPAVAVRNDAEQAGFRHGEDVWLVEGSTGEMFAAALLHLIADEGLRGRLGENLRRLYVSRFDWPHLIASAGLTAEASGGLRKDLPSHAEGSKA